MLVNRLVVKVNGILLTCICCFLLVIEELEHLLLEVGFIIDSLS